MHEVRVSPRAPPPNLSPPSQTGRRPGQWYQTSPLLSYPPISRSHSSPGSRSRFDFVPNVKAPRLHFRFRGGRRVAPGSSAPTLQGHAFCHVCSRHAPRNVCSAHALVSFLWWPSAGDSVDSYVFPFFSFPRRRSNFMLPPQTEMRLIFSNSPPNDILDKVL